MFEGAEEQILSFCYFASVAGGDGGSDEVGGGEVACKSAFNGARLPQKRVLDPAAVFGVQKRHSIYISQPPARP